MVVLGSGRILMSEVPPQGVHLLLRIVKWFRGGLVCKAHRLSNHSTLGSRVIKKKKTKMVNRSGLRSMSAVSAALPNS
jgi:hypothetical protein